MKIKTIINLLAKKGIVYLGERPYKQYLFTDQYTIFLITKNSHKDRYETNLSYVDRWLSQWQLSNPSRGLNT